MTVFSSYHLKRHLRIHAEEKKKKKKKILQSYHLKVDFQTKKEREGRAYKILAFRLCD